MDAKSDRELLELAAKAAGIEYQRSDDGVVLEYFGGGLQLAFDGGKWNPLTDDGDALRLAVKLRIDISLETSEISFCGNFQSAAFVREESGDDPYASTRRAIVRVAAAMAP